MRLFLRKLVLFGFYAGFVYVLLLCVWGDWLSKRLKSNLVYHLSNGGHSFSRLREVHSYNDLDILFIGSSHAYRGFDVRIFKRHGYKTFNLGTTSQTPIQSRYLLTRYLDRLSPGIVVMEVYPTRCCADGIESTLDLVANAELDYRLVEFALSQVHIKVLNALLYKFYRCLLRGEMHARAPDKIGKDTYVPGGFVERELKYYDGNEKFDRQVLEFKKRQLRAMADISAMLRKRKIRLYLVFAPITRKFYQSFSNLDEFAALMRKYGEYHDFNLLLNLDSRDCFLDHHHLNQNGVKMFDEKLIELLESETGRKSRSRIR